MIRVIEQLSKQNETNLIHYEQMCKQTEIIHKQNEIIIKYYETKLKEHDLITPTENKNEINPDTIPDTHENI